MAKQNRTVMINNKRHDLVVFAVREFDDLGRPCLLQLVREDQMVKLSEEASENVFITAFVPRSSLNCDYRKFKDD
jgi:hypothetical protein